MSALIHYPPLRVSVTLLAIIFSVTINQTAFAMLLIIWGIMLLAICRVPLRSAVLRLLTVTPFIVVSILFFMIYDRSELIPVGLGLSISKSGLDRALLYSARLISTVLLLTVCFHRLPIPLFLQALHRLKVPGIFIELASFTLRFISVIKDEAQRMLQARKSRGMLLRSYFSLQQSLELARLLGGLLVRSLRRSERIYAGMMSRGYRGVPIMLPISPFRWPDSLRAALLLIPFMIIWAMDKG